MTKGHVQQRKAQDDNEINCRPGAAGEGCETKVPALSLERDWSSHKAERRNIAPVIG
jgi:hypothetical protein